MPKLWQDTIEAHRRDVREAILDVTARLVASHGPRAVTMSRIAETAGIGRATLYKYFPDVEAILGDWHAREIEGHLDLLVRLRDSAVGDPLEAVIAGYANIVHGFRVHHATPLGDALHGGDYVSDALHGSDHVSHARHRLHALLRDLCAAGVAAGTVRSDAPPDEIATYCLHACAAAGAVHSADAVNRLVRVIVQGLRPPAITS